MLRVIASTSRRLASACRARRAPPRRRRRPRRAPRRWPWSDRPRARSPRPRGCASRRRALPRGGAGGGRPSSAEPEPAVADASSKSGPIPAMSGPGNRPDAGRGCAPSKRRGRGQRRGPRSPARGTPRTLPPPARRASERPRATRAPPDRRAAARPPAMRPGRRRERRPFVSAPAPGRAGPDRCAGRAARPDGQPRRPWRAVRLRGARGPPPGSRSPRAGRLREASELGRRVAVGTLT